MKTTAKIILTVIAILTVIVLLPLDYQIFRTIGFGIRMLMLNALN